MVKEVGMALRSHPESGCSLSGPVGGFDRDEELVCLGGEQEWQKGRRNAITLVVCEGRVRFTAEEETVEARPEMALTRDAKVRYDVEDLSEDICLLTVATSG
jgi:mannose-6-phosphate isomerase-like protein (cupin superfamily)